MGLGVRLVAKAQHARVAKLRQLAGEWQCAFEEVGALPAAEPDLELLRSETVAVRNMMTGVLHGRRAHVFEWVHRARVSAAGGPSPGTADEPILVVLDMAESLVAKRRRDAGPREAQRSRLVVMMETAAPVPGMRIIGLEERNATGLGWYPVDKRYRITADQGDVADELLQQWMRAWLKKQRYASFEARGRWVTGVRVTPRAKNVPRFVASVADLCDRLDAPTPLRHHRGAAI